MPGRNICRFGTPSALPMQGVLAEHVPTSLVDQVLADTGRVQRRLRRLPARAVVWFVRALTLFHG
jgi:hypothetical protein